MPTEPILPVKRSPAVAANLAEFLRKPLVAALLLVAAVFAVYAPALDGQFLWDDVALVRRNGLIRSPLFCLEVFRQTLFDNVSNFYRPTQTLVFIADYWAWGLNPFGYHLTSILIHVANACLLCFVLRGVLAALLPASGDHEARANAGRRTDWLAFAVALLWAVHPVHSAAVAYVSGSADSLAMLCCLSAWLACTHALGKLHPAVRLGWGGVAFAGLLLGLCSKEIAGIWLALFGVYLFALRPGLGSRRARLAVLAGSALALVAYLGLRHLPPPGATPPPPAIMPAKWLLMLRALGDYGSLLIYPKELFMERQVFAAPGLDNSPNEALYFSLAVAGVGMLAAFAAGCSWPGQGRGLRRFGAGWFLLGFLPVSNLFSLNASVAEHWLYLPSIGFLLFVAGVAVDFSWERMRAPRLLSPAARGWALALLVLLPALALGTRTWLRTFDWLDEKVFYAQTVRDAGDVARARVGLAMSLSRQDRLDEAIVLLRDITTRYPKVIAARINLAHALLKQGHAAEARHMLEEIETKFTGRDGNPREIVAAVDGLDRVEGDDPGWLARRRALLDGALPRNPDLWELVLISLREPGLPDDAQPSPEALARVRAFVDAHWWHAPARYKLGTFYEALGRPGEAVATFRQAARLDVHDDGALAAAAAVCVRTDRLTEAMAFQEDAVHRQPDSPRQRFALAEIFLRRGDQVQAEEQLALANNLVRRVARR